MSPGPVLALDSCGRVTTLALGELHANGVTVFRTEELAPRTVSADLVPAFARLLDTTQLQALVAIVAVRGPGSFTGIRAGLSAVKALSEAARLPVVGLSRLAVLAATVRCEAAALDAGRGQVYLRTANGEALATRADAERLLGDAAVAVCDDRIAGWFPGERHAAEPTASAALRFAEPRLHAQDWHDALTLDALYLWREEQMFGKARA